MPGASLIRLARRRYSSWYRASRGGDFAPSRACLPSTIVLELWHAPRLTLPTTPPSPGMLAVALLALPACGSGGESKPTEVAIEVSGKGEDVKVTAPKSDQGRPRPARPQERERRPARRPDRSRRGQTLSRGVPQGGHELGRPDPRLDPGRRWRAGDGAGPVRCAVQNLSEGNYIVFSSPEGEGEPATAEFKVEGGGADGKLPNASGEIVASEYTFEAKGLKPGKNKVLFPNAGTSSTRDRSADATGRDAR